jgi:type IV secretion system protein VirD4
MRPSNDDQVVATLVLVGIAMLFLVRRRRWRGSGTAFGTAAWMSESLMKAAGMLAQGGLVLGRTFGGKLIRLPNYCHVLCCGGSGSGKGVSIVLPNLLTYRRGSVICFDTKGDLYQTAAGPRRRRGDRIIRLAPFNGGTDGFNPLDTILRDSPMLVDSARAIAEALVVRTGRESDPHWNAKAVQLITAVLVLVLLRFHGQDRTLITVQEIISDPELLRAAVRVLQSMGGIPARLGAQITTLFDKQGGGLTKEGAGVLSTATQHLSFLDSDLVARSLSKSTFDPKALKKPGTTLFLQIPPEQLEAQKGLLRCWVSTLVRLIGSIGNEQESEVLLLIDEASALGNSLPALEEALVRGRSAGVRILLAYQSDSQIKAAFPDKPTLLYDNCGTQIYLGAASSYETAERLSKSIGDWTQVVESYSENESHSRQRSHESSSGGSSQSTWGSSTSYSENGRALLRPEEILTLDNDCLIVLQRGLPPILAKRVKWYQEPEFNGSARRQRVPMRLSLRWRLIVAVILGFLVWAWQTHERSKVSPSTWMEGEK